MNNQSAHGTKLIAGSLHLCLLLVFAFAKPTSAATIITQFGNSVGSYGGWTYDPVTSTIIGSDGTADTGSEFATAYQLYSPSNFTSIDLSQDSSIADANSIQLRLTGLLNSGDPNLQQFSIALVDANTVFAYWTFNWSDFTSTSSAVVKSIDGGTAGAFDFSNIIYWELNSGTSGLPLNATFTKLEAIPEPSSVSLLMLGAAGLVALRRLRKV